MLQGLKYIQNESSMLDDDLSEEISRLENEYAEDHIKLIELNAEFDKMVDGYKNLNAIKSNIEKYGITPSLEHLVGEGLADLSIDIDTVDIAVETIGDVLTTIKDSIIEFFKTIGRFIANMWDKFLKLIGLRKEEAENNVRKRAELQKKVEELDASEKKVMDKALETADAVKLAFHVTEIVDKQVVSVLNKMHQESETHRAKMDESYKRLNMSINALDKLDIAEEKNPGLKKELRSVLDLWAEPGDIIDINAEEVIDRAKKDIDELTNSAAKMKTKIADNKQIASVKNASSDATVKKIATVNKVANKELTAAEKHATNVIKDTTNVVKAQNKLINNALPTSKKKRRNNNK